ncbi:hypothetical protein LTS18_009335 [Coniosporium uncinatum]|uniref:Uncharacterized protein n=1 Tax=Coniosporium uncinatum TaxID=93489 RepID=A0ACC3D153_9PEZI|nr:hypothetical protein LTS18_009335 [Coniosporium uncinatum]
MSDAELMALDEECPSTSLSPHQRPVSPLPELSLPPKQVAPIAKMTNKRPAPEADGEELDSKRTTSAAGLAPERGPNSMRDITKDRSGGIRPHSARRKRNISAIDKSHEQPKSASTRSAIPTGTIHVGGKHAGYQQVAAADEGSSTKSVVDESVEPEDFAKTPVNFADLPKELRQNVLTYAVHLRAPTKGPTTTIPPSTRRTPDL